MPSIATLPYHGHYSRAGYYHIKLTESGQFVKFSRLPVKMTLVAQRHGQQGLLHRIDNENVFSVCLFQK